MPEFPCGSRRSWRRSWRRSCGAFWGRSWGGVLGGAFLGRSWTGMQWGQDDSRGAFIGAFLWGVPGHASGGVPGHASFGDRTTPERGSRLDLGSIGTCPHLRNSRSQPGRRDGVPPARPPSPLDRCLSETPGACAGERDGLRGTGDASVQERAPARSPRSVMRAWSVGVGAVPSTSPVSRSTRSAGSRDPRRPRIHPR